MKLEDIGFYTLSDERAASTTWTSPLKRCELVLTDRCNFNCPYCRGLRSDCVGDMSFEKAVNILGVWMEDKLENVRFSGGEPTLYSGLADLVEMAKKGGVKHIAISTNGSAPLEVYMGLVKAGANDFSVSLDACCASTAKVMSGGMSVWNRIVGNIKKLSDIVYVTVGVVVNEQNIGEITDIIMFADSLGVGDIRIISAAQYNAVLENVVKLGGEIMDRNPILKYRVNNFRNGRNVRGLKDGDCTRCWLMADDMVVCGDWHFPCIIYMRELGEPVGRVKANMREDRRRWVINTNTHDDPICKSNCLDVCIDYNNRFELLNKNLDKKLKVV